MWKFFFPDSVQTLPHFWYSRLFLDFRMAVSSQENVALGNGKTIPVGNELSECACPVRESFFAVMKDCFFQKEPIPFAIQT